MDDQDTAVRRRFWFYLPWAVLAFSLGITILAWRSIASHENVEVRWATRLAADAIATDLKEDMEWQRIGLDRLALLWDAAEIPRDLWIRNAELYIRHRPGCVAVEWLPITSNERLVVTQDGTPALLAFAGVPKEAMQIARDTNGTVFSGPDTVRDGTTQWAVVHPAYKGKRLRGFVLSFFESTRTIDENLSDTRGFGYSFGVTVPGQPEHVFPGTDREHEQDWAITQDVSLPGVTWQLRVWPTPAALSRSKSEVPEVALAVGTVLSALLALTAYFGLGAARSSASTRRANDALQREMAVREGAEKELRRTRDELELRVQERTAELASTNLMLQKEVTEHEDAAHSLQELTARLFRLQDEERRRLARELHDGASQSLVALTMNMAMIREAVPAGDAATMALVRDCSLLLKRSMEELRTLSYLLHPPLLGELGLAPTLRDFVDGFATRSAIQITLNIDPELGRFEPELELTVYRVVQEALANVHRHAQSRIATVALVRQSGFVHLEISDAGRGIDPQILAGNTNGVGIAGMRERVRLMRGHLEIRSGTTGTTVDVVLPTTAADVPRKKSVSSSPVLSDIAVA